MKFPGQSRTAEAFFYASADSFDDRLADWLDVNPRQPTTDKEGRVKSGQGPKIIKTMLESPIKFPHVNRGITLLVSDFKEIDQTGHGQKAVVMTLSDKNVHGICDGAHTYLSGLYAKSENKTVAKRAWVFFRVRKGMPTDLMAEVSEGLNTSLQVDERSIANFKELFEPIKSAMGDSYGADKISYYQGDSGNITVVRIVGLIEMMNRIRFPGDKYLKVPALNPISIYRNSGKVLTNQYDSDLQKPGFMSLIKLCPDILQLYSKIKRDIPLIFNKNGGKFGSNLANGFHCKSDVARALEFIDEKTYYPEVPDGWIFPILSAFRGNLYMTDKYTRWIQPLDKVYPLVIDTLVTRTLREATGRKGQPPSEIGRDQVIFQSLMEYVGDAVERLENNQARVA